jgi:hypothetical protein
MIKREEMIMTNVENFINDVTNDAFLKAVDNDSGFISIPELDQIVFEHPYYADEESLDVIQDAVHQIENILKENNRIVVAPTSN